MLSLALQLRLHGVKEMDDSEQWIGIDVEGKRCILRCIPAYAWERLKKPWGNRTVPPKYQVRRITVWGNSLSSTVHTQIIRASYWITFNKNKSLFSTKLDLNLRKTLTKCSTRSIASYGAETLEYGSEIPCKCWERMGKINWTNCVKNEEILHGFKEERNIVHTIKRRKASLTVHILRRNHLLKHFIRERR
jgi:hypothetical protein